jgi:hypothetical protein
MSLLRSSIGTAILVARIALPLVLGFFLARELALSIALLTALALATLLPALGAWLLTTLHGGEITWRNHAAGWLLPWGYALGRGKLPAIAAICGACWLFLFGLGIAAARLAEAPPSAPSSEAPALARWLLVGGWLVDGIALLYCLGTLRKNFTLTSEGGRTLLELIAFVAGLIVASALAAALGHLRTAALIAAGPALALGGFYALWIGVLLTFGRNTRWN